MEREVLGVVEEFPNVKEKTNSMKDEAVSKRSERKFLTKMDRNLAKSLKKLTYSTKRSKV